MDTIMSDSSMHHAVESFTLPNSHRRSRASTTSSATGTTTFIREQCSQITDYISKSNGRLELEEHGPFLEHTANFLDYLERSVAMTPEMRDQSAIDDCMRLIFASESVVFPPVFAKRAKDLYLSWVLDDQTIPSASDDTTAAADGEWAEITVKTSAANMSRERTASGEHGELDLENAMAAFGVEQEDEHATMLDAGIHTAFDADESTAKTKDFGVFNSSAMATDLDVWGKPLDAALKFHADLLVARATIESLLYQSSAEEIAGLKTKKSNSIIRVAKSLVWMGDYLNPRYGKRYACTEWPKEFWVAIEEPFAYVVEALGRIEEWNGCQWVSKYTGEIVRLRDEMVKVSKF